MLTIAFVTLVMSLQQTPCQTGQVIDVDRRRDFELNICGAGVVALRGVEPPLGATHGGLPFNGAISGEMLGIKDYGPEAINFMLKLLVGKRVTLVADGWRIGDREGRRYAYVFLPDKTLLNAELIRHGYGYASREGSHPRRDEFIALEAAAHRQRVGVWSEYPK